MSKELDAHERLITLGVIVPDEPYSPTKGKEGWYSQRLKAKLEELDKQPAKVSQLQRFKSDVPYSKLVGAALDAVIAGDQDTAMQLRAELMMRFRRNDSQVEAALFKEHTNRQNGLEASQEPDSIDLTRLGGIDFLVDGFIPARDQTQIFGKAGTGKTTAALAIAFAVINGTGLLDHSHPAKPASVLFIASDSGAAPLIAAMQDMGVSHHPALSTAAEPRFYVWAAEPSQGASAWMADLRGCIRLQQFVQEHRIRLVLIDSCKAVCSAAGLEYTDNTLVTALLTYFKEVICAHTAVVWINHDGVQSGASAGAKAWKEIPSAIHQITKDEQTQRRTWNALKMRVGRERRFDYDLRDGQLILSSGEKPVGDCEAQIVEALSRAYEQGRQYLNRSELREQVCVVGGPSHKTLDNTLSKVVRAKHPAFTRVDGRQGCYRLASRFRDALEAQI